MSKQYSWQESKTFICPTTGTRSLQDEEDAQSDSPIWESLLCSLQIADRTDQLGNALKAGRWRKMRPPKALKTCRNRKLHNTSGRAAAIGVSGCAVWVQRITHNAHATDRTTPDKLPRTVSGSAPHTASTLHLGNRQVLKVTALLTRKRSSCHARHKLCHILLYSHYRKHDCW